MRLHRVDDIYYSLMDIVNTITASEDVPKNIYDTVMSILDERKIDFDNLEMDN